MPEGEGDGEKSQEIFRGQEAQPIEQRHQDIAQHLHDRPEHVDDQYLSEAEEADPAVARIEDHVAVPEERLERAALPAGALAAEHPQVLGRLGPADRDRG
jgi:hypothetical protein